LYNLAFHHIKVQEIPAEDSS